MAWFNCTSSQNLLAFSVAFQGWPLLPGYRPFFVIEGDHFLVQFEPQLEQRIANGSVIIQSGSFSPFNSETTGLKVKFNIKDEFGNNIDTILRNRNNPDLGKLEYSILDSKSEVLFTKNIIFMGKSEAYNC